MMTEPAGGDCYHSSREVSGHGSFGRVTCGQIPTMGAAPDLPLVSPLLGGEPTLPGPPAVCPLPEPLPLPPPGSRCCCWSSCCCALTPVLRCMRSFLTLEMESCMLIRPKISGLTVNLHEVERRAVAAADHEEHSCAATIGPCPPSMSIRSGAEEWPRPPRLASLLLRPAEPPACGSRSAEPRRPACSRSRKACQQQGCLSLNTVCSRSSSSSVHFSVWVQQSRRWRGPFHDIRRAMVTLDPR